MSVLGSQQTKPDEVAMSEFPMLPLFVDAYLSDTGHLSPDQHGLYLLLLMLMWRSPKCRVPNDDDWLAHKLKVDPEVVRLRLRPIIAEFCIPDTKHWITQKRLREEWRRSNERRVKASSSAKYRWYKENNSKRAMRVEETRMDIDDGTAVPGGETEVPGDPASPFSTPVKVTQSRWSKSLTEKGEKKRVLTDCSPSTPQTLQTFEFPQLNLVNPQCYPPTEIPLSQCGSDKPLEENKNKSKQAMLLTYPLSKKERQWVEDDPFENSVGKQSAAEPAPKPPPKSQPDPKLDRPQIPTVERELFERGKALLGKDAGGLIAKLLKAKGGNHHAALSAIVMAEGKQNPREYIGAVVRGASDERGLTAMDYGDRAL